MLDLIEFQYGVFLQYDDRPGLMTKREIRVQLLAELEIPNEGILWDIGAGVGSIGLEALRLSPKLQLLSVEKRIGALALITKNADRLKVKPSKILEVEAKKLLESSDIPKELKNPDRVILGGGGKRRGDLLKALLKRLKPGGIIVIPIVTIEAISEICKAAYKSVSKF